MIDIIDLYQHEDKLPKSNIVLFATWVASCMRLYAYHFPKMDTKRHMWSEPHMDSSQEATEDDVFHHISAL